MDADAQADLRTAAERRGDLHRALDRPLEAVGEDQVHAVARGQADQPFGSLGCAKPRGIAHDARQRRDDAALLVDQEPRVADDVHRQDVAISISLSGGCSAGR
ncbi:MAG: hypothetical protein ABI585_00575 [Betaproteobacteria bacterium]